MSTVDPVTPPRTPYFGALLRMSVERVQTHMLAAIHAAGFTDFQPVYFAVFSFPPPDGMRPSELAHRWNMTRQAINYLLIQLEDLGYVERRAPPGSDRRLVYLTPRGWQVGEVQRASLRALQADWSAEIGPARFAEFLGVLQQLSGWDGEVERPRGG